MWQVSLFFLTAFYLIPSCFFVQCTFFFKYNNLKMQAYWDHFPIEVSFLFSTGCFPSLGPNLWLIILCCPANTFALCFESAENEFNMPGVNTHTWPLVPKHFPWLHQGGGLTVSVSLGVTQGMLEKAPPRRPNFPTVVNCLLVVTMYQKYLLRCNIITINLHWQDLWFLKKNLLVIYDQPMIHSPVTNLAVFLQV